nr:MAG TPA: hypothetical protein [Caudoviricetes sp.]
MKKYNCGAHQLLIRSASEISSTNDVRQIIYK